MANIFINLPCPIGNGVGAPVDVSALGGVRTISAAGPFVAAVNVEMSNELAPTGWAPLATFNKPDGATITVVARWMRCRVSAYKSGTPTVNVGSSDSGSLFAALPVTPGDGWGAAVDVSALGLYKTAHVAGPFRGNVQIEVSEDGATFWSQIGFGFSNPGQQSEVIAAKFARVRRVGVPVIAPGLPVVHLGGSDIGSGTPGNEQSFSYAVTGLEPDPSAIVITLPVVRADALYNVQVTQQTFTYLMGLGIQNASKTNSQFVLSLSAAASVGDVFAFTVSNPY